MEMIRTGVVCNRETGKNKDGYDDVLLLQTMMSSIHDIQTVQLMTHAGDDINPPDGSRIVVLSVGRAYKIAIASEDGIEPEVAPGEREIYSSVDGARMARVRLTSEGLVVIQNQDESLLQILSDLINTLVTITTFGSPVKHVLSNDSQDALNDIKDRLSSLLGEI